ncbi:MAG TPA: S41 family peptidase [Bacteroidales bacterium]|nr:S41 family peptidase [Bacteroidales bacterium]
MYRFCFFVFLFGLAWQCAFPQRNNFIQAYDSMHAKISNEYPMGKWKGIDWDDLNAAIRPKIEAAAVTGDSIGFYTALQEYITCIHDGHVNIRRGWQHIRSSAMYRSIGGSYGFSTTLLDDGRLVATLINPGSPASLAGMKFGATILAVNDRTAASVLDTVKVLWSEIIPATGEGKLMNQCRFIGRAPVGATMKITYRNRDDSAPVTAVLNAVDDQYATYNQTSMWVYDPGPVVTSAILQPEGYGYIKLTGETAGNDSNVTKQVYADFRDALLNIRNSGSHGLILDMRVNSGGMDALSAALAGFFYNDTALYEMLTWFNTETRMLEPIPLPIATFDPVTLQPRYNPAYPNGAQYIEPQSFNFPHPVMVLVSPRAISSGEGLPMALQKLPQCKVLGFHGTNGSFALVGTFYNIIGPPDSLNLRFPFGCSTDRSLNIQLDSDSTMTGGVIPDIRVPMNDTVIDQLYCDSLDVEMRYAIKMLNSILATEEPSDWETSVTLEQNVPNPFNAFTDISCFLPLEMNVTLDVLDLSGRKLRTLIDEKLTAGWHTTRFTAGNLPPGIYLYRLKGGNAILTRKCLIR